MLAYQQYGAFAVCNLAFLVRAYVRVCMSVYP